MPNSILAKCIFYSELLRSCSLLSRASPTPDSKMDICLHDFLTFTDEQYTCDMSVVHWGKHISNALNSTDIFAICHGGSIWSMIDIKVCLRISVHKLVRLCEFVIYGTALALIDLLGYFKSGLDFNPSFSSGLRGVVIRHIHAVAVMRERAWNSLEGRNQSQIISHSLNNKSIAHLLVIIYK